MGGYILAGICTCKQQSIPNFSHMSDLETKEEINSDNIMDHVKSSTLIISTEVDSFHKSVAWVLIILCGFACTGLIILRFMIHDYLILQWVQSMCIIPLCMTTIWFVYFTSALVRNIIGRRNARKRHETFRLDLVIGSLKLSIGGMIYTAFWMVFLLHSMLDFRSHLIQCLALLKLASTHIIYAVLFRSKTEPCIHNGIAGCAYIAIGSILESSMESNFFKWINLILGIACTLSGLIEAIYINIFLAISLFTLGSSFFVAAFVESSRYVVAGLSLLGFILAAFWLIPSTQVGISNMTAMMFGQGSKRSSSGISSPSTSSSGILEEGDDKEPLIQTEEERNNKHFIVL